MKDKTLYEKYIAVAELPRASVLLVDRAISPYWAVLDKSGAEIGPSHDTWEAAFAYADKEARR